MSYQGVKDRLYHGHSRKIANNTYLTLELGRRVEDGVTGYYEELSMHIEMRLHGNLVARFHPDYLELYSSGWYSATTKSRLNLALDIANVNLHLIGSPYLPSMGSWKSVYQQNYQWYYGNYHIGDPKFRDGMKLDYAGKIINGG